jgi:hypothetical protein
MSCRKSLSVSVSFDGTVEEAALAALLELVGIDKDSADADMCAPDRV